MKTGRLHVLPLACATMAVSALITFSAPPAASAHEYHDEDLLQEGSGVVPWRFILRKSYPGEVVKSDMPIFRAALRASAANVFIVAVNGEKKSTVRIPGLFIRRYVPYSSSERDFLALINLRLLAEYARMRGTLGHALIARRLDVIRRRMERRMRLARKLRKYRQMHILANQIAAISILLLHAQ
jgi:hypothetical protein